MWDTAKASRATTLLEHEQSSERGSDEALHRVASATPRRQPSERRVRTGCIRRDEGAVGQHPCILQQSELDVAGRQNPKPRPVLRNAGGNRRRKRELILDERYLLILTRPLLRGGVRVADRERER